MLLKESQIRRLIQWNLIKNMLLEKKGSPGAFEKYVQGMIDLAKEGKWDEINQHMFKVLASQKNNSDFNDSPYRLIIGAIYRTHPDERTRENVFETIRMPGLNAKVKKEIEGLNVKELLKAARVGVRDKRIVLDQKIVNDQKNFDLGLKSSRPATKPAQQSQQQPAQNQPTQQQPQKQHTQKTQAQDTKAADSPTDNPNKSKSNNDIPIVKADTKNNADARKSVEAMNDDKKVAASNNSSSSTQSAQQQQVKKQEDDDRDEDEIYADLRYDRISTGNFKDRINKFEEKYQEDNKENLDDLCEIDVDIFEDIINEGNIKLNFMGDENSFLQDINELSVLIFDKIDIINDVSRLKAFIFDVNKDWANRSTNDVSKKGFKREIFKKNIFPNFITAYKIYTSLIKEKDKDKLEIAKQINLLLLYFLGLCINFGILEEEDVQDNVVVYINNQNDENVTADRSREASVEQPQNIASLTQDKEFQTIKNFAITFEKNKKNRNWEALSATARLHIYNFIEIFNRIKKDKYEELSDNNKKDLYKYFVSFYNFLSYNKDNIKVFDKVKGETKEYNISELEDTKLFKFIKENGSNTQSEQNLNTNSEDTDSEDTDAKEGEIETQAGVETKEASTERNNLKTEEPLIINLTYDDSFKYLSGNRRSFINMGNVQMRQDKFKEKVNIQDNFKIVFDRIKNGAYKHLLDSEKERIYFEIITFYGLFTETFIAQTLGNDYSMEEFKKTEIYKLGKSKEKKEVIKEKE
jgi:hypothetical protein